MARLVAVSGRVRWPSGVVATRHVGGAWTIEGDGPEASAARVIVDELEYPGPSGGYPAAWDLEELAERIPGGKVVDLLPVPPPDGPVVF